MQNTKPYLETMPNEDGFFGQFGGAFIPPQLEEPFREIREAYDKLSKSFEFLNELKKIRKHYQGRPTPITYCKNLSDFVGGGSNAMGIFSGFIDDAVKLYGVEPAGKGTNIGEHSASLTYGSEGIMHGFNSIMLKDEKGNPAPVHSVGSGIDYPSIGPEHAYLHSIGRTNVGLCTDEEAIDAFYKLSQYEGIIPALESAHAVAFAMKYAAQHPKESILVNLSGRGDKDIDYVIEHYPIPLRLR